MFYLLYKPKGISSFKCIKTFQHKLKLKKCGHSGTLDPLASGLLLLASDDDTKLLPYIANKHKTYITTIQFGTSTTTYDAEGDIIKVSNNLFAKKDVDNALDWIKNQASQIPPIFSAKKINGIRSYELARKNINIDLKPQQIEISNVELIDFDFIQQQLKVKLQVSNGTYIRSLANDLGLAFNTYSFMAELERVEISGFDKKNLKSNDYIAIINIQPFLSIESLKLSIDQIHSISLGKIITFDAKDGEYLIYCDSKSKLALGIVEVKNNYLKVKKLFGNRL
ncbi:tRNA pseudouridine(55) synthase TruB [Mycoplasmopsis phocirhinis]|uniref:tRNA pseudouridine synthase B n=1 Tax=Mycoplasmopsis phocirhinis TaxID=142650 RepID=A0A4V0ZAJ2_9BACT|nr:tRNA pseudouridine(55) synthase TruB [Mycoplasmopsis phocirhinis]QBF34892.1 tRNA pseudouridine(55) synthase TruB [Mycoplasmopsis phocirhinis]